MVTEQMFAAFQAQTIGKKLVAMNFIFLGDCNVKYNIIMKALTVIKFSTGVWIMFTELQFQRVKYM